MEYFDESLEMLIDSAGWLAPILFILLHLLRPFFFLPVIVVCIAGGVLFGFVEGAILSFIGLSLMSLVSYQLVNKFPKFRNSIFKLKKKVFQDRTISVGQIMILRIMPFIHFHLLSLYLMEMAKSFKEYMYYSVLGLILPAVLYTSFGQAITELPLYATVIMFILLLIINSYLGKLNETRGRSSDTIIAKEKRV
ncbi:TVP38/TMEM64 family protein [Aquibacillus rhizosphaerae]|uniref:TVP38/TMEM64 family membrane protein n=1 Tax=Aquibacillus rhizosphaerae TaxID=3051431 RepID=A0ABT7L6X9_9BACI|nr:VTT domain-containing protein [Aquibacillus sp. LR5S19]MDL4841628.1 VTT domain-containing protein [Aquibacillus sp. LR5S19]